VPLLFIGINPRRKGNEDLFDRLAEHETAFRLLAGNQDGGREYIGLRGTEPHYKPHFDIVREVFGPGARFEDHAAVTELFFCATEDAEPLRRMMSPCANTYMDAVLDQVKPRAIIAVGETVMRYLRWRFEAEGEDRFEVQLDGAPVQVVRIIHPGHPKAKQLEWRTLHAQAVETARCAARA
jgi:hypothetical protein